MPNGRPTPPDVEQLPQYRLINQARGLFHIPATGAQVPGGAVGNPMLEGSKALETLSKTFAAFARTVEEDFRKKMPEWAEAGIDQYKGKATGLHIFGQMKPAEARKYLKEHQKEFPDFVVNHASRPDFLLYMQYAAGTRHPVNGKYMEQLHNRSDELSDPNKTPDFEAVMAEERQKFLEGLAPDASFYYRQGMASVMSEGRDSIEGRFRSHIMKLRQDRVNDEAVRDTVSNLADNFTDAFETQQYSSAKVLGEDADEGDRATNNAIRKAEGFYDAVFNQSIRDLYSGPKTIGLKERDRVVAAAIEIAATRLQEDDPDMDVERVKEWLLHKVEYAPGKTFAGTPMQAHINEIIDTLHRRRETKKRRSTNSTVESYKEFEGSLVSKFIEVQGEIEGGMDFNEVHTLLKGEVYQQLLNDFFKTHKIPEGMRASYMKEGAKELLRLSGSVGTTSRTQNSNAAQLVADIIGGKISPAEAKARLDADDAGDNYGLEGIIQGYKALNQSKRTVENDPLFKSMEDNILLELLPAGEKGKYHGPEQRAFGVIAENIYNKAQSIAVNIQDDDERHRFLSGGWRSHQDVINLFAANKEELDKLKLKNRTLLVENIWSQEIGREIFEDLRLRVSKAPGTQITVGEETEPDPVLVQDALNRAKLLISDDIQGFLKDPKNHRNFDGSDRGFDEIQSALRDFVFRPRDNGLTLLQTTADKATTEAPPEEVEAPPLEEPADTGKINEERAEAGKPLVSPRAVNYNNTRASQLYHDPTSGLTYSALKQGAEAVGGRVAPGGLDNTFEEHTTWRNAALKELAGVMEVANSGGEFNPTVGLIRGLHSVLRNEGTLGLWPPTVSYSVRADQPSRLRLSIGFLSALLRDPQSVGYGASVLSDIETESDDFNIQAVELLRAGPEGRGVIADMLKGYMVLKGFSLKEIETGKLSDGGFAMFGKAGAGLFPSAREIPWHIALIGEEGYVRDHHKFFSDYEAWKASAEKGDPLGDKDNTLVKIALALGLTDVPVTDKTGKWPVSRQLDGEMRKPTSIELFIRAQHNLHTIYDMLGKVKDGKAFEENLTVSGWADWLGFDDAERLSSSEWIAGGQYAGGWGQITDEGQWEYGGDTYLDFKGLEGRLDTPLHKFKWLTDSAYSESTEPRAVWKNRVIEHSRNRNK